MSGGDDAWWARVCGRWSPQQVARMLREAGLTAPVVVGSRGWGWTAPLPDAPDADSVSLLAWARAPRGVEGGTDAPT